MLGTQRRYLKLNRNILIALAASITVSAIFAQLITQQTDYLNATYTIMVDHLVYFTTFGSLYYISHRKRYLLQTGKLDRALLRHDMSRIIASLGVSEIVYTAVRWFLQYYLLIMGHDPYIASAVSQGISIAVYLAVINMSMRLTRLYRNES